jgi:hypothetical protein
LTGLRRKQKSNAMRVVSYSIKAHRSPQQTIQTYCHFCVQSRSDADVENCTGYIVYATGKPCPFYEYRMGHKRPSVKVMRRFCLQCMIGSATLVRECETKDCLIHPYRMGKNPARAGKGASRERMIEISRLRMAVSR